MSQLPSKGVHVSSKGKKVAPSTQRKKQCRFIQTRADKETQVTSVVDPSVITSHAGTFSSLSSTPAPSIIASSIVTGSAPSCTSTPHIPPYTPNVGTLFTPSSAPTTPIPSSTPTPYTPSSTLTPSIPSSTPTPSIPSSTPSPPMPTVELNSGVQQQGNALGSTDPDKGLCIGVRANKLFPSGPCSTIIHSVFGERVDPDGYSWAKLSDDTIQFYWDEFQKKCYWDATINNLVKAAWQNKAKERYRQYIHNMSSTKKNPSRKKPIQVKPEVWTAWNVVWNSEEFKKKSQQNKINRRRGVADGPALSTHTSGSASHAKVAIELEKHLGHAPSCFDVFLYTHTKDHDGITFLSDRAKQVHDNFIARRDELLNQGKEVDDNKLFYEAVGGHDRKRKLYGLGSYGDSIGLIKIPNNSPEAFATIDVEKEEMQTKVQKLEELVEKQQEKFNEALLVIQSLGEKIKTLTG